jgi:hypothetical protein
MALEQAPKRISTTYQLSFGGLLSRIVFSVFARAAGAFSDAKASGDS